MLETFTPHIELSEPVQTHFEKTLSDPGRVSLVDFLDEWIPFFLQTTDEMLHALDDLFQEGILPVSQVENVQGFLIFGEQEVHGLVVEILGSERQASGILRKKRKAAYSLRAARSCLCPV